MKISRLTVENFRTLETIQLDFPGYYSAISGKNNSGKTNVVKAIRSFFGENDPGPFDEQPELALKPDFTNWKHCDPTKSCIQFKLDLLVHKSHDAGLYRFLQEFLGLQGNPDELQLSVTQTVSRNGQDYSIQVGGENGVVVEEFKAQEVFKKIRSSRCLYFHNSTQQGQPYVFGRQVSRMFGGLPAEEGEKLKKTNQRLQNLLRKSAQRHQKELIELLGRLEEKYSVTLSLPRLDFEEVPLMVSLGEKGSSVPLDDWGSGTQNRTVILMHFFRAKKNREASTESDRITPILLIEEPESFLHPSAQAEFGKMLQDLAEEFAVQVLATTHSPYMLSLRNPSANVLLRRRTEKGRALGTEIAPTNAENWMEPFGLALGIDNEAFANWRHVLFKRTNQIILVEGETDKTYLEMLREDIHGSNALQFKGEIFPYGGTGFFSNTILIKFVMSRFNRFVITYDLDQEQKVTKTLQNLGLKKGTDFIPVGVDVAGKRDIEGLLPDAVRSAVYSTHSDLVAIATSADGERDSARQKLKSLLLDQFKKDAKPGIESFGEFYKLTRSLNRTLR